MNREGKLSHPSRVALYARVSSDQQAQEGTIDSQVSCLRERIERDGGVVNPALCFIDDGVSGATFMRAGLERLRDLAAAGAPSIGSTCWLPIAWRADTPIKWCW